MLKNKLNFKLNIKPETLKVFVVLTLIFTIIGVIFGRLVMGSVSEQPGIYDVTLKDSGIDNLDEVNQEHLIYMMQHGVFAAFDNALSLGARLEREGYVWSFKREDELFVVFTYLVGEKEQLNDVAVDLDAKGISFFVRTIEVVADDLGWLYFLKAVKQIPFEIEADFIQAFSSDEMHIWGYYVTLSSAFFEPLSAERQKMLLEIYEWLLE